MIEIQNVFKYYGEDEGRSAVLKDVNLSIKSGEFVAIIGTSGSGKTTLLNTIGTLDSRFEGSLKIAGKELVNLDDKASSKLRSEVFGFVFQQFNLLDHLSALENVILPRFFGEILEAPEKKGIELLKKVGLEEKVDARPPQLSGGQKQRIAIARALFRKPKVILCDEPTGSLDRKTGVEILSLFTELNRDENITLVMVTHEEHIAKMASRIVRMEDGEIVSDEKNMSILPALHIHPIHSEKGADHSEKKSSAKKESGKKR